MARDFTKDTNNYLHYDNNQIGLLLNGAAKISAHAWVYPDTFSGGVNDNRALTVAIDSDKAGIMLGMDGTASNKLRVGGRSQSADGFQARDSNTAISSGVWTSIGGVWNIPSDTITPYVAGVAENSGAVTFGHATAWTRTSNSNYDAIGFGNASVPPAATNTQFDGGIAEVAIWTDDIGAEGFASLAKGVSALLIRPESLIFYQKLNTGDSTETDLISKAVGTVGGTIAKRDHPRIYYPYNN